MAPPHINLRRFLSIALIFLAACLVALVLGEVLVRLAAPQNLETTLLTFLPDPDTRYRLQPGIDAVFQHIENTSRVRTNSLGIRGGEIPEKQANEFRILGLGDSFGFGFSVSEEVVMFQRCESILNAQGGGRSFKVINAAIPGFSVAQEYAFCQKLIPIVKPDMLLVVLYVGNDFFDSDPDRLSRMTAREGSIVLQEDDDPSGPSLVAPFRPMLIWLHGHSHLFRFLRKLLNIYITHWGLNLVEDPDIYMKTYPPGSRYFRGTDALYKAMADFVGLAREQSLSISFAVVPTVNQVRPERWNAFLRRYGQYHTDLIRTKPQERITSLLDSLQAPYLDFLPFFESADLDNPLYYKVDPHLNARGHDLAGQLLAIHVLRIVRGN